MLINPSIFSHYRTKLESLAEPVNSEKSGEGEHQFFIGIFIPNSFLQSQMEV
jgi:hypothetical protein